MSLLRRTIRAYVGMTLIAGEKYGGEIYEHIYEEIPYSAVGCVVFSKLTQGLGSVHPRMKLELQASVYLSLLRNMRPIANPHTNRGHYEQLYSSLHG